MHFLKFLQEQMDIDIFTRFILRKYLQLAIVCASGIKNLKKQFNKIFLKL